MLSFSFDKGLLAPLEYRLLNNGMFKVSPDFHQSMRLGHHPCNVLASCMLLHVAPGLVLSCVKVRTDWRPQIQ